jgi:ATP-binding cassette, subfamily G (WHITE), member 2, PDR
MGDFSAETSVTETSVPESVAVKLPVSEVSVKILETIFDYALNKFSDTRERLEAGRPKFLSVIEKFVVVGATLDMCLPAFPFKVSFFVV